MPRTLLSAKKIAARSTSILLDYGAVIAAHSDGVADDR